MRVVCINDTYGNSRHLELYKVYDTIDSQDVSRYGYYTVYSTTYINPLHKMGLIEELKQICVNKRCFTTLEEYRSNKINKLLND